MKNNLQLSHANARQEFLKRDGVLGVAHGAKLANGIATDPEAIVVFVSDKKSAGELAAGERIPSQFQGFKTDVRVPVLAPPRATRGVSAPPPGTECLPDYHWLDWGTIHRNRTDRIARGIGARGMQPGPAAAAAGLSPPATSVFGDLFLIQDPDDSLIVEVAGGQHVLDLIGAYKLFREKFRDDYDFINFYLDIDSGVVNMGNAQTMIFNDVAGIGKPAINNRADWGTNRLLAVFHHCHFNLRTLLHEFAHQWCSYVNYRLDKNGPAQTFLHQDFLGSSGQEVLHWGRWPEKHATCMDYDCGEWIPSADGTFQRVVHDPDDPANDTWFGFCPLDLYLMGLIPAEEVPPFVIVRNPQPGLDDGSGPYQADAVSLGIENILFEEGERNPAYQQSQRIFHQAVIVCTRQSVIPNPFLVASENWRKGHTENYRRATGGRSVVNTTLLTEGFADLYLRATDNPAGADFRHAPDLWVRRADDGGATHETPLAGQSNWIYIRVRNKGPKPYTSATVNAYLADAGTLAAGREFEYPTDWKLEQKIGSATVANVPGKLADADGTVVAKIEWPAGQPPIPPSPQAVLLCELFPLDLAPNGLHTARENKKLAQRSLSP